MHGREGPQYAVAIGRLPDGRRFIARSEAAFTLAAMEAHDPLDRLVTISNDGTRNAFTLAA